MPQLVPFYFVNEITFTFVIIAFIIYILSKFFLPSYLRLFYARISIISVLNPDKIDLTFDPRDYNIR